MSFWAGYGVGYIKFYHLLFDQNKKAASKLVGAMRPGSSGAYLLGCRTQRIVLVKIQIVEKGRPR